MTRFVGNVRSQFAALGYPHLDVDLGEVFARGSLLMSDQTSVTLAQHAMERSSVSAAQMVEEVTNRPESNPVRFAERSLRHYIVHDVICGLLGVTSQVKVVGTLKENTEKGDVYVVSYDITPSPQSVRGANAVSARLEALRDANFTFLASSAFVVTVVESYGESLPSPQMSEVEFVTGASAEDPAESYFDNALGMDVPRSPEPTLSVWAPDAPIYGHGTALHVLSNIPISNCVRCVTSAPPGSSDYRQTGKWIRGGMRQVASLWWGRDLTDAEFLSMLNEIRTVPTSQHFMTEILGWTKAKPNSKRSVLGHAFLLKYLLSLYGYHTLDGLPSAASPQSLVRVLVPSTPSPTFGVVVPAVSPVVLQLFSHYPDVKSKFLRYNHEVPVVSPSLVTMLEERLGRSVKQGVLDYNVQFGTFSNLNVLRQICRPEERTTASRAVLSLSKLDCFDAGVPLFVNYQGVWTLLYLDGDEVVVRSRSRQFSSVMNSKATSAAVVKGLTDLGYLESILTYQRAFVVENFHHLHW